MAPIPTSRLMVLTAVIAGAALLGGIIWHQPLGHAVAGWTGHIFAAAAVRVHVALAFMGQYVSKGDLVNENLRLADQLAQAQAERARLIDREEENAFLRAAAGIHDRVNHDLLAGEVFSYISDGAGRQEIVNRGRRDQVASGDIVLTAPGELVGVVTEVFDDHAVIRTLGDPNFEVTARVMGTDVSGLVKTDGAQDVVIDLIQKSETVTEGQTVVTSGNDQFPAGLIIGTIRSVDSTSTALFQVVHLTAAVADTFIGRVVIMHP